MTIARAIRLLLGFITVCIIVWSFFDFGRRIVVRWTAEHGSTPSGKKITLTLLHWGDKIEDEIVEKLIAGYRRTHPNIVIRRVNPGHGDFRPKLKTMLAAGTPPDIFYLPPDIFPELATQDLIRPIDDYVEKERAAGRAEFMDDFWPILLRAWHFDVESGQVGKGKLYGLPKDFTTAVMWINLDLFEAAGVKVPYDGWTWDEFEDTCRKIRDLTGKPGFEGRTIYGGLLEIWSDPLRNIIWTYGGDYFGTRADGSTDFRQVLLDQPPAIEAMEMIRRVRLIDKTVFNATGATKDGFQEFLGGNIGIDGPVGRWKVPRFVQTPKLRWACVPIPYKKKEYQASQIYLTAWTMSKGTPHPDECFELMKFLCGPEGAVMQSHLGLAIPPLMSVAKSKDFLAPPGFPDHNAQAFLDAVQYARLQQVPRETEWANLLDSQSQLAIQTGQITPVEAAGTIKQRWAQFLNSPLRQKQWSPMNWSAIIATTIGVVLALAIALWMRARREALGPLDRAQERAGFLFIAPWLIGFLLLALGPMVVSLLLGFTRWSALTPMASADSVGLANYRELLGRDNTFYASLAKTVYYVVLGVPCSQIAALGVALLMNSKVRGITVFRTIFFVPSVVSGVALAVLWLKVFNNDYGTLNAMLRPILRWFGELPPDWFGVDAARWAIPAFVIMGLWGVGSGMIIYLAGLKGISPSLYEAATIDGAGPVRRFANVTLPMLSPLIFYNVVMGIIGSFQIFTQAKVMTNGGPGDATLFYVLYLYRQAFEFHNMGYASAMAWVLFLIVLALTIVIFRGSRSLVYYEGLKT